MPERAISISSQDELKSGSATMGMVFFSLMSGRPDQKLSTFMDLGLAICDIITKGPSLTSSIVANYRDFAKVEAFRALDRQKQTSPDKLVGLESEAKVVKQTLESLKSGIAVSEDALNSSASFFTRIYRAM